MSSSRTMLTGTEVPSASRAEGAKITASFLSPSTTRTGPEPAASCSRVASLGRPTLKPGRCGGEELPANTGGGEAVASPIRQSPMQIASDFMAAFIIAPWSLLKSSASICWPYWRGLNLIPIIFQRPCIGHFRAIQSKEMSQKGHPAGAETESWMPGSAPNGRRPHVLSSRSSKRSATSSSAWHVGNGQPSRCSISCTRRRIVFGATLSSLAAEAALPPALK